MTPNPPSSPPSASVATGFALMLETACEDFEVLQRLTSGASAMLSTDGQEDHRGAARARMALAKSFVFHTTRARRICEHGAGSLNVDRIERRRFLEATEALVDVRDVNEHGFDAGHASRGKSSRPSMHHHEADSAILDETSLVVLGDTKILMGPLNLHTVYAAVDRMGKLAGFANLR